MGRICRFLKRGCFPTIMNNKIGLLGGTFNPVHLGHIELGKRVLKAFDLDEILYVLSARPPHKERSELIPARHRWKMLNLALDSHPHLVPCDIEMERSSPSWTYQTIGILKSRYPDQRFYFLSGSEGFLRIRTWRNYRMLLSEVNFIVILRKSGHRERLEDLLQEENAPVCRRGDAHPPDPCVWFYRYGSDHLTLSSTKIREKIKRGQPVSRLVPAEVWKYMKENNLYGCQ